MVDFLNIAVYLLLTYGSFKLLKLMGLDIISFLVPKNDHNIYFQNFSTEKEPIKQPKQQSSNTVYYKMNYSDRPLKAFLNHKRIKKKVEYIDNIFDLI